MREVRQERTGWRDQGISERHRLWGYDIPMMDIDFLCVEYDKMKPVAIFEYKNEHARTLYKSDKGFQVLSILGDMSNLPVFACRYADDFSWFIVVAINVIAKSITREIFVDGRRTYKEEDFVKFLYRLRGRPMPKNLFKQDNEPI